METEKYYFRVGVFILAVASAFVWYLMFFGIGAQSQNLTRYAIYFDNSVAGLTRGAPIKLKGIEVGLVDDIRFVSHENDRILVIADIEETAPVREDTVASISFQGITGTTYLALENMKSGEPPVFLTKKKGEDYPVIKSQQSDIQAVLANAPETLGKLSETADQLQKLLSNRNITSIEDMLNEIHTVLAEATGTLREFKMLARTLRDDPSIILRGTTHEGYKVQK